MTFAPGGVGPASGLSGNRFRPFDPGRARLTARRERITGPSAEPRAYGAARTDPGRC